MASPSMLYKEFTFALGGDVVPIRQTRPKKSNALNDALVLALGQLLNNLPEKTRAAVLGGEAEHFGSGLDLEEQKERDAGQGLFSEAMMAAIAQRAPEAKARVRAFLEGKASKVKKA